MGKLFYIMGKSATGKDMVFKRLTEGKEPELCPLITYTTRPIRAKETDGVQYYFVTDEILHQMLEAGRVIELRSYNSVHGIWNYFTADSDKIDLAKYNYLGVGTLVSYRKIRDYYGNDTVVPIYIEAEDRLRLEWAMKREGKQAVPDYNEMCRRYLSDQEDFSEKNIADAGIEKRFKNNEDKEDLVKKVQDYIKEVLCMEH